MATRINHHEVVKAGYDGFQPADREQLNRLFATNLHDQTLCDVDDLLSVEKGKPGQELTEQLSLGTTRKFWRVSSPSKSSILITLFSSITRPTRPHFSTHRCVPEVSSRLCLFFRRAPMN